MLRSIRPKLCPCRVMTSSPPSANEASVRETSMMCPSPSQRSKRLAGVHKAQKVSDAGEGIIPGQGTQLLIGLSVASAIYINQP
jgi:hypothetical protein